MTSRRMACSFLVLAGLAAAVALPGCSGAPDPWKGKAGPRVVVTFPPLDSFVRNVAGDHAAIHCLCTTKGPHHYEYEVKDLMWLRDANLFFSNGLGLDDRFADPLQKQSNNPRLRYVELGARLPPALLLPARHEHEHEHGEKAGDKHEHGHEHEHGEYDPHVWLGIPQAVHMVETIRDELKRVDPSHAEDYDKNAAAYVQTLQRLEQDGKKLLADKKNRKIISFHESLNYFAKSFGLTIAGTIEQGPGDEPTAARLAELVKLVKGEKVRVIAVEPQYSKTTSADVLRKELNKEGVADVVLVEVDPLETADPKDLNDPKWYVRKMRKDLEDLAGKLQ